MNSGFRSAQFALTLSAPATTSVVVNYATADGTAVAGSDYTAVSGTVTIPVGSTTRTITVNTIGDVVDEDNEAFHVAISGATGATVGDSDALGTILDNDLSSLSVNDITVAEGNSGTAVATFTVSMTTPNSRTVTVDYFTANFNALAPADYAPATGTLTFTPGTVTQSVTVAVAGDVLDELQESFSFNLAAAVNAAIARSKGSSTIVDDDEPPTVSISDLSLTEGNRNTGGDLTLTLSAPSGQTVRVQFTTADGTAVAGSDYQTRFGDVQFLPGVTSRIIPVTIIGDRVAECNRNLRR